MFLIELVVLVAVGFGGFYYRAQPRGLLTTGQAAEGEPGTRRISLLTEAAAYAGVILLLVGGVTAISQRWNDITRGGQAGVFAAAAVFFFLAGIIVRQVREPAIQRLAGVAWFLSVAGVAGAVWLAMYHVHGKTDAVTAVAVGAGVTLYAAALWLVRPSALQNLALFAGLVITILGIADIITVPAGTGPAPSPAPNLPTLAGGTERVLGVVGMGVAFPAAVPLGLVGVPGSFRGCRDLLSAAELPEIQVWLGHAPAAFGAPAGPHRGGGQVVDPAGVGELVDVGGDAVQDRRHPRQVDHHQCPLGVIAARAQVHRRRELPGVQEGQPAGALP